MIRFLLSHRADGRPVVSPVCTRCGERARITDQGYRERLRVRCGCRPPHGLRVENVPRAYLPGLLRRDRVIATPLPP